ncbi:MAG TPA: VWA domain-containing protein, partial [Cyclobacteriaceae bacterium]
KRSLTGKNMTIILSDGLDTGEPGILAAELHQIKLRTRRLFWLNPLKGMKGYQPKTRGMMAALPEIDHFMAAHNVDSLLQLENFLAHA